MSVTGIGGAAGTAPQSKDATGKTQSPEETFLAYVKKSPVERWIESWLKALKEDKRAIFRAAAEGQKAADLLLALAGDNAKEAAA